MSKVQTENDRQDERSSGWEFEGTPCCFGGVGVSGPYGKMSEMMRVSPCAGWLRRHRLAVYAALTLAGLGFLILQVGWVLGIIAFFRTI